jgi:hypothetical protein
LDTALNAVMLLSNADSNHQQELSEVQATADEMKGKAEAALSAERAAKQDLAKWEAAWGREKAAIRTELARYQICVTTEPDYGLMPQAGCSRG